jgi:hypothetical protein
VFSHACSVLTCKVCGETEVEGDFIVPIKTAHLEGALNINLEGAFHSPLGAKVSFLGPWYGSEQVRSPPKACLLFSNMKVILLLNVRFPFS